MRYTSVINPYLSRRLYPSLCEWWQRTTANGQIPLNRMVHDAEPNGKFHAREVSNFVADKKDVGDIRIGGQYVTIETPDDIKNMRPDAIVRFDGILYRVQNVTRREVHKTKENMRYPVSVYVLSLVR